MICSDRNTGVVSNNAYTAELFENIDVVFTWVNGTDPRHIAGENCLYEVSAFYILLTVTSSQRYEIQTFGRDRFVL